MKIRLIRPCGSEWSAKRYLNSILKGQHVESWKKEHGENWRNALEAYIHESICNVIKRQYVEILDNAQ